jgi:hypothetical protein
VMASIMQQQVAKLALGVSERPCVPGDKTRGEGLRSSSARWPRGPALWLVTRLGAVPPST